MTGGEISGRGEGIETRVVHRERLTVEGLGIAIHLPTVELPSQGEPWSRVEQGQTAHPHLLDPTSTSATDSGVESGSSHDEPP